MEQELLNTLDGFEGVWQRVLSGREDAHIVQQAKEQTDPLDQVMGLWTTYAALSQRTKGEARQRFTVLADETRDTARALQTEYFLRTGDIYRPKAAPAGMEVGVLTGMRRAYQTEQGLAREFEDNEVLADIAARHADVLRDMIGALLRR